MLVSTTFGTSFGSVATFSCNTDYMLSHQQVVVCGADGMWSASSPSCLGEYRIAHKFCEFLIWWWIGGFGKDC